MPPARPARAETAAIAAGRGRSSSSPVRRGWGRLREHPRGAAGSRDGEQRPAGRAGEPGVEGPLEAADADRRSGAKPLRARAASSSSSAMPTSPVTSIAALPSGCSRASAGPSASGDAVAGEDRRAGGQLGLALQALAATQAREDEARVPGDAAVLEKRARGRPRPSRRRPWWRRSPPARIAAPSAEGDLPANRLEGAQRRDLLRVAIGGDEVFDVDRLLRGALSSRYIASKSSRAQASAKRPAASFFGRSGRPGHRADHEGDHRDQGEGKRAGDERAVARPGGRWLCVKGSSLSGHVTILDWGIVAFTLASGRSGGIGRG